MADTGAEVPGGSVRLAGPLGGVLAADSGPAARDGHLLARDEIHTAEIAADAKRNGLITVAVDGERSADATVTAIARQFGDEGC